MISNYISEDLIFLDKTFSNKDELIDKITLNLFEKGYTLEGYGEFLKEREKNYPTGLSLPTYNIAIPHGNPEYIKHSFISVIKLTEPIKIGQMDDPENELDVSLFFLLGLSDGNGHLEILKAMMKFIQNDEAIHSILESTTPNQIRTIIKKYL